MSCPDRLKPKKRFSEFEVVSSDDIMDLVALKRANPEEYQKTLKDIAEILRDIAKIVDEVNK